MLWPSVNVSGTEAATGGLQQELGLAFEAEEAAGLRPQLLADSPSPDQSPLSHATRSLCLFPSKFCQ